jgi:hypothetical protein
MRRFGVLALALLAAMLVPAAHAAAKPRAALVSCTTGAEAVDRAAVFEGRMRARPGTARMEMRFRLKVRGKGDLRWARIEATGLEDWLRSEPGVENYVFTKTVQQLPAPADYRMVVEFRWLDAADRVIAQRTAVSRPCRQPDLRANLRARRLSVLPGSDPSLLRYVTTVRNTGKGTSAAYDVVLTVGETETVVRAVELAPGEQAVIEVEAPRCAPGAGVSVVVDGRDEVEERDEADNAQSWVCAVSEPF